VLGGDADACVTGVRSLLAGSSDRAGPAARFVGVLHQRSPIAAMVRVESDLHRPSQLDGRRLAVCRLGWFLAEFQRALSDAAGATAALVPVPVDDAQAPLRRGEVDMIASWSELVPWARRRAGVAVRAVPIGPPVYTTGLVVHDRVPVEVATRLRDAFAEALGLQAETLAAGLAESARRAPRVPAGDVQEEWELLRVNAHHDGRAAAMRADRWSATLAWMADVHGTPRRAVDEVCRPELLAPDYAGVGV